MMNLVQHHMSLMHQYQISIICSEADQLITSSRAFGVFSDHILGERIDLPIFQDLLAAPDQPNLVVRQAYSFSWRSVYVEARLLRDITEPLRNFPRE